MKTILLLTAALSLPLLAAPPREPTLTRYSSLWTDSPFTTKPPPPEGPVAVNPFEGYSLGGISKLEDGYFAILLNAKDPEEKVLIRPGYKSDFEILEVNWSDTNWKETTVKVKNGAKTGTIAFDDAQLSLKAPTAAPQPAANNANAQPAQNNNPQRGNNQNGRRPRPRVVVPPKTN
ncbi:hypothetical protein [Haloferula sargassicola]|uniref:Uncharacterized protein n=1 Tax=Haloferula sargassicola TaxID=490096 RepID=A0ABP9US30_9BACT